MRVNSPSSVRVTPRKTLNPVVLRMAVLRPGGRLRGRLRRRLRRRVAFTGDEQVCGGHHEEEEQQQDRHRGADAEVPGEERRVVDVERDEVTAGRLAVAEEDVRRVEVVEGPQEQ